MAEINGDNVPDLHDTVRVARAQRKFRVMRNNCGFLITDLFQVRFPSNEGRFAEISVTDKNNLNGGGSAARSWKIPVGQYSADKLKFAGKLDIQIPMGALGRERVEMPTRRSGRSESSFAPFGSFFRGTSEERKQLFERTRS
jgi:hypothetical protein